MSTENSAPNRFQARFLCPRFWGIWLGVGLLWLIHTLPYRLQYPIGKGLGKLLYLLGLKRRRLALRNIELCFPEWSKQAQRRLLKAHFDNLGLSLIETGVVWWGSQHHNPKAPVEKNWVRYKGQQHVENAQKSGQGILFLMPHFTTLEISGLFISFLTHYHPVYRPHNNALMDYLIRKGRTIPRFNPETQQIESATPIANSNTRQMLKVLKAGEHMILLPDQRYRKKGHIMVPFFGHDAKSNPATSKIAKLTHCTVIPTFTRRLDEFRYEVEFLPPLDQFPSGDYHADTLRLHQLYETEIRANPEQYLWVHNRWDIKKY